LLAVLATLAGALVASAVTLFVSGPAVALEPDGLLIAVAFGASWSFSYILDTLSRPLEGSTNA